MRSARLIYSILCSSLVHSSSLPAQRQHTTRQATSLINSEKSLVGAPGPVPFFDRQRYTIGVWYDATCRPSTILPFKLQRSPANPYISKLVVFRNRGQQDWNAEELVPHEFLGTWKVVERSTSGVVIVIRVELRDYSTAQLTRWFSCCSAALQLKLYINAIHEEVELLDSSLEVYCLPDPKAKVQVANCDLAALRYPKDVTSCDLLPQFGYTMPAGHDASRYWLYQVDVTASCAARKGSAVPIEVESQRPSPIDGSDNIPIQFGVHVRPTEHYGKDTWSIEMTESPEGLVTTLLQTGSTREGPSAQLFGRFLFFKPYQEDIDRWARCCKVTVSIKLFVLAVSVGIAKPKIAI
ncbi:uncharacterized protein L969DRAFT_87609 [Mixia osmundae IAM 14324]|uniref:uncharacterized protein n=1 Tax=Mixia osmundae (strain CBS 9802 / IAM 14324 / JCM 22182 / KY 12970) TaxID=764103 RepID=UPI0004A557BF|nr:uncharacterized protein L969DRAFT_87609 [Mixia osmundae IAM 14324]KEI39640.1 hypothetical protein L969DRAFT_87609 [Mixia osmundae IAM 14324]